MAGKAQKPVVPKLPPDLTGENDEVVSLSGQPVSKEAGKGIGREKGAKAAEGKKAAPAAGEGPEPEKAEEEPAEPTEGAEEEVAEEVEEAEAEEIEEPELPAAVVKRMQELEAKVAKAEEERRADQSKRDKAYADMQALAYQTEQRRLAAEQQATQAQQQAQQWEQWAQAQQQQAEAWQAQQMEAQYNALPEAQRGPWLEQQRAALAADLEQRVRVQDMSIKLMQRGIPYQVFQQEAEQMRSPEMMLSKSQAWAQDQSTNQYWGQVFQLLYQNSPSMQAFLDWQQAGQPADPKQILAIIQARTKARGQQAAPPAATATKPGLAQAPPAAAPAKPSGGKVTPGSAGGAPPEDIATQLRRAIARNDTVQVEKLRRQMGRISGVDQTLEED